MTPIKVLFVLLLLIPVAILMRYFLSRLSAETPKQRRPQEPGRHAAGGGGLAQRFPSIRRKQAKSQEAPAYQDAYAQTQTQRPAADPDFVPRQHTQLKRTERISFSELGIGEGSPSARTASSSQKDSEMVIEITGRKKTPRSEKEPTKRQKRNNRKRSRQRDIERRKRERNHTD